ncbi:MAG: 3-deoxy-manno-octulosonate cytidylyltransferase [Bacteroidales bacterium]|nr:3-deoxy-manno-octulosonate cytidylyltransferase [Bacteroidales bacterium]
MKIAGIIPAREQSSRFPGKPLADICGRPMIWWVHRQCRKVEELDEVYVATDSDKIYECCRREGIEAIMTSPEHRTGTDRVGEAASKIDADLIVNIQGDEPLIEPDTIRAVIRPFLENPNLQVSSLMSRIEDPSEATNPNICKVVTASDGTALLISRAPVPYSKNGLTKDYHRALGIFGFRKEALRFFCEWGRKHGKGRIEAIEDIEMLRLIEQGYRIHFSEVTTESLAVDTPEDLEKVIQRIKERNITI